MIAFDCPYLHSGHSNSILNIDAERVTQNITPIIILPCFKSFIALVSLLEKLCSMAFKSPLDFLTTFSMWFWQFLLLSTHSSSEVIQIPIASHDSFPFVLKNTTQLSPASSTGFPKILPLDKDPISLSTPQPFQISNFLY